MDLENAKEERRFYVKEHYIDCDEDVHHEFKGHRNFCHEELPTVAVVNQRRKAISRNLCGFLNTGKGGIVYLGVDDDGRILGISLTPYQKDHVLLSVQDTFSRFDPPVDSTMYEVRFIPVIRSKDEGTNFTSPVMDLVMRKTPHLLQTSKYCWCDNDAKARFDVGIIDKYYVIEVEVFPWNPNNKLAVSSLTRVQPLFSNEEKLYFVRGLAGLHQPTVAEVIEMTESDAYMYYTQVLNRGLSSKQHTCPSTGSEADHVKSRQCFSVSGSMRKERNKPMATVELEMEVQHKMPLNNSQTREESGRKNTRSLKSLSFYHQKA